MAEKQTNPDAVEPANDPSQNTDAVIDPALADAFAPGHNQSTDNPGPEPEPADPTNNAPAEPEPEPTPAEPAPVVEPAQEPAPQLDFTQIPEYQKLMAENGELKQLQKVVMEDPQITQAVIDKINNPQAQAQAQPNAPQQIQMPKPPQYANMEDLSDPNSETSKWFATRDQVLAENVKNNTQASMDQQINQKFQQYEQQKAEVDKQQSLQNAMTSTQQKVGADNVEWQKFKDWANNPGKDMNDMLNVMYQIYQGANGNSPQPQQPEPVTQPINQQINQPITTPQKAPLPNYSGIGGQQTNVVKSENDAFNDDFFSMHKNQRKF